MAARQTSAKRAPTKASAASVPRGARIPQPALVLWIVRTLVIGALVLFFASPAILTWAGTQRTLATGQPGGLLFGGLLPERTAPSGPAVDRQPTPAERD